MAARPLRELVDPGWAAALDPAAGRVAELGDFLRAEVEAGRPYLPAGEHVLRAFTRPFADVRVLIVGQDPYPTPGHPIGLSFAVERHVRPVPRSLQNIYRELRDDLGVATPEHGDLTAWADQGILLLNRVLTVREGASGSHRGKGWEQVTELAIRALVARGAPLVAILWGRDAGTLRPLLGETPVIASAHPSPLSASGGFFGSRPFSRANELLTAAGAAPVDWSLGGEDPTVLEEEYNPRRELPRHLRPAPPAEAPFSFELRAAKLGDVPDMLEIYNHYVANTTVTFDEDALTLAEMRAKFRAVQKLGYPWIVAETPSGQVIGYAYVYPWKPKAAYRFTVENSIYLRPASTGKGLGTALLQALLVQSKAAGVKEIIAVIADRGADASIGIHKKYGFTEIGHMGKVGFKFGRWLGTELLQTSLK